MAQGVAGIDDILDHQNIAPFDGAAQVFEDTHLAAGLHPVAVRGRLQKINLDRQVQLAHQIGDKDKTPAQQPDDHQLVRIGKLARDLSAQILDARGNRLGRDHFVDHIFGLCHGVPLEIPPHP